MPLNIRFDRDVAILSNFGRLLNDPRHFDASRDVQEVLDQGYRKFILELANVREVGTVALGLLTTLTRLIRRHEGEAVLARMSPGVEKYLEELRVDSFWEFFPSVEEAEAFYRDAPG